MEGRLGLRGICLGKRRLADDAGLNKLLDIDSSKKCRVCLNRFIQRSTRSKKHWFNHVRKGNSKNAFIARKTSFAVVNTAQSMSKILSLWYVGDRVKYFSSHYPQMNELYHKTRTMDSKTVVLGCHWIIFVSTSFKIPKGAISGSFRSSVSSMCCYRLTGRFRRVLWRRAPAGLSFRSSLTPYFIFPFARVQTKPTRS